MKITSKEQAIEEFRKVVPGADGYAAQLAVNAWDSGIPNFSWGKADFEFVREPEPVVMYTGHGLIDKLSETFPEHAESIRPLANVFIDAITLILARRAEMLRAMGSEELVGLCAEHIAAIAETTEDEWSAAEHIIDLVCEHIEANRPELTDAVIDGWLKECKGHGPDAALSSLGSFIAHRAAEYRSPRVRELEIELAKAKAVIIRGELEVPEMEIDSLRKDNAELRAENERLSVDYDNASKNLETLTLRVHELAGERDDLRSKLAAEFTQSKEYFTELSRVSAELELLKRELTTADTGQPWDHVNHHSVYTGPTGYCWFKDSAGKTWVESMSHDDAFPKSAVFYSEIQQPENESSPVVPRSPQPVDDSDYWGIAMHGESVSLVHRNHNGWELNQCVQGSWLDEEKPITLDPTRIFKVTSQPRGPLKVPSKRDATDAAMSESSIVERNHWFAEGAQWAIEWIRKANGAE